MLCKASEDEKARGTATTSAGLNIGPLLRGSCKSTFFRGWKFKFLHEVSKMKLKKIALTSLLLVPTLAHADLLDAGVKWTAFSPIEATNSKSAESDDGELMLGVELYLEHSLQFIPDVRVEFTGIEGADYKYLDSSATAYYEVIDGDSLDLDLGVGITHLKSGQIGEHKNSIGGEVTEFSGTGGHLYVASEIAIPAIHNLAIVATAKKSISSDLKEHDVKIAAQYRVNMTKLDWVFQGGFRDVSHKVTAQDIEYQLDTSGVFASVGLDF